jgi:hypothetical protein
MKNKMLFMRLTINEGHLHMNMKREQERNEITYLWCIYFILSHSLTFSHILSHSLTFSHILSHVSHISLLPHSYKTPLYFISGVYSFGVIGWRPHRNPHPVGV